MTRLPLLSPRQGAVFGGVCLNDFSMFIAIAVELIIGLISLFLRIIRICTVVVAKPRRKIQSVRYAIRIGMQDFEDTTY